MNEVDISGKNLLLFIEYCEKRNLYPSVHLKSMNDAELIYSEVKNNKSEKDKIVEYVETYPVGIVSVDKQTINDNLQKLLLKYVILEVGRFIDELIESVDYNFSISENNSFYIKNELQDNNPDYYFFEGMLRLLNGQMRGDNFDNVFCQILDEQTSVLDDTKKLYYKLLSINLIYPTSKIGDFSTYLKKDIQEFIKAQDDDSCYANFSNLAYFKIFLSHEFWNDEDIKNTILKSCEKSSIMKKNLETLFPYFFNKPLMMRYSENENTVEVKTSKYTKSVTGKIQFNIKDFENVLTPNNYIKFLQIFESSNSVKGEKERYERIEKLVNFLMNTSVKLTNLVFLCEEGIYNKRIVVNNREGRTIFDAASSRLSRLNILSLSFDFERQIDFKLSMQDKLKIKSNLLDVLDIIEINDLNLYELLSNNNLEITMMEKQLNDNIPIVNKITKKLKF